MSSVKRVHESFYSGLKEIASLEDSFFDDVIDGLTLARPTFSISKLAENVSSVKSLENKRVWEIFYTVGGFVSYIEKGDKVEDIVEDICAFVEKESVLDFKVSSRDNLTRRLIQLLNVERIYFAAKASILRMEHNHVFIQAKAITDIRPIFKLNVEETPTAGMIIHKLHIHYKSDDERDHKDIFFALDASDIKSLKELLIRAEKKEKSLQAIFDKSQMSNLSE